MLNAIRNELTKMFFQKKNHVVILGHLFMLGLCYLGFRTSKLNFIQISLNRSLGIDFSDIMSYVDAMFFARTAMVPTYFIIFPIFICTIAGDLIAGEIQEGNLKLYASRAVSRSHIIFTKLSAMVVVAFLYSVYFAIANLAIGWIFFGPPGSQLIYMHNLGLDTDLVFMQLSDASLAYLYTTLYCAFSVMALGCMTFFFSTVFNRMTTATVAGITIYFVCYLVGALPFCAELRPYLLSTAMNGISVFWLERIPFGMLTDNLCLLGLYISIFSGLALTTFTIKDMK